VAEDELVRANEELAAAIADSAAADPEVPDAEVASLRAELRRELERVAAESPRRAA
jgi:capsule polysaccharide export protein KpsE/RkpR